MKILSILLAILMFIVLATFPGAARSNDLPVSADALHSTIAALDTQVFDDFNHCDRPGRLEAHARHFSPDIEFYHDNGGVTWTRDSMIANTAKYVCGNYRRELVPGTLEVHPVKDFGAISLGTHRFCQFADGSCNGLANFVMVWKQDKVGWKITRVLSYGHRASAPMADAP